MRAREILVRRVPVYMLILAVVLTALLAFTAYYAQLPPVKEFVKALRPKEVTVTIRDATFKNVILADTDSPLDGRANVAVVTFSTDGDVDGLVKVTVTLKDATGAELDRGSRTVPVSEARDHIVFVHLNNVARIADVKLVEITFEQVLE